MKQLTSMGTASNEKREQRIMQLRVDFRKQKVITVASAAAAYGYSENTIRKWAKDGKIPLLESGSKTVVPLTFDNTPDWLQTFVK